MTDMRGDRVLVGVFSFLDDTLKAVEKAKSAGLSYKVFSPVPNHELEAHTMPSRSPIRFFTFAGALAGLAGGFALAIWTSLDWPHRASAKPIVSLPPFAVIGYECTILIGAIATLLALFYFCRIPFVLRQAGYDPRFSRDKFGVVVGCDLPDVDKARVLLEDAGAEEVEVRYAL